MLRLKKHTDLIYSITGKKNIAIAKAFVRFQEYYENPIFKGKKGFTLAQVEKWWDKENQGEEYYTFWQGFNIPGWVILDIIRTKKFYPLTRGEKQILKLLEDIPSNVLANSVIIGIGTDIKDAFDHEFAHGLYGTNKDYRRAQLGNVLLMDKQLRALMKAALKDVGYHESVVEDEIHAYMSTYVKTLPSSFPMIFSKDKMRYIEKHTKPFVRTFKEFKQSLRRR